MASPRKKKTKASEKAGDANDPKATENLQTWIALRVHKIPEFVCPGKQPAHLLKIHCQRALIAPEMRRRISTAYEVKRQLRKLKANNNVILGSVAPRAK
ncbi:unnamed protein product, partial [Mesorhabditis spiculigera]